MRTVFLRIVWTSTKWIATVIAFAAAITTALFSYDLLNRDRWGYPWWLLAILIGIAGVGWGLRREAVLILRQVATPDDHAFYNSDEEEAL